MDNKNMTKCKACEKDIAKGVKRCPDCGKDQRNFFKKHKIITGFLILLFLGVIGNALGDDGDKAVEPTKVVQPANQTTSNEDATVEEPKDDPEEVIIVSAVDLAKEYEENEVRADKNYKGKMVEVKGTISSIGVSFNQTYVVLSSEKEFSLTDIQCFFNDDSEIDKIADLNEGDIITVRGKVSGKSMNVGVDKCILK